MLLSVRDLRVHYGPLLVLDGVSLDVAEGSVVVVVGGNGAGKSTLLRAVSGLEEPGRSAEGDVRFDGRPVLGRRPHVVARMGLAHVPEGRRLFASSTVEDNLLLGGYRWSRRRRTLATELESVYGRFPVLHDRRHQLAGQLSGGEQQLLAVARALMSRPRLLAVDEPSLGLAPRLVGTVFDVVRQLASEGMTILLAEQAATLALTVADHAYVLDRGRVALHGKAGAVAQDPAVRGAYLGNSGKDAFRNVDRGDDVV